MYKALLYAVLWFASGPAEAELAGLTALACKGTTTTRPMDGTLDKKVRAISMGIIVDFNARTVQGFFDYPAEITAANDAAIEFYGSHELGKFTSGINGHIDRVTGEVTATATMHDWNTGNLLTATTYALQCSPAQRVF